MYELQTTVNIGDKQFHITNDGDFRMVLDCFKALTDETLSEDLRVLASLLIFYNEFDSYSSLAFYESDIESLVDAMYKFFNMNQESSPGARTEHSLIDWDKDEQLICSAINNVANKEIRSEKYVHWWTFMGYYLAIGESVMSTVVSIRDKIVKHKKLEKWEQEFKRDNPEFFHWKRTTVQDREAESLIRELWNQGGEK